MLRRRQVPLEVDVVAPRKGRWVLRAGDQKASRGKLSRRLEEELVERALPVFGIRAQVREGGAVRGDGSHRAMLVRIDASVQWRGDAGIQPRAQLGKRLAARVAEHEIE